MKIGLLQMNSTYNPEDNIRFIKERAKEAKKQGVVALFLPECFYSMSDGLSPTEFLISGDKAEDDHHYNTIKNIAKEIGIALIGGSAATSVGDNVVNRTYSFLSDGSEMSHYDKMHLFSCDIVKNGQRKSIDESDVYTAGTAPRLIEFDDVKIGLGVCFDLRYPEMSRNYTREGAQILTFSSAFTVPTGRAHWHTLVRARAIENQCFVIASAQVGRHNERIITYGHSLVVDPWGDILCDAKEEVGLSIVDLDLDRIESVRKSIKVFK